MSENLRRRPDSKQGAPAQRVRGRSTRESQAKIGELTVKLFTDNPAAFWSLSPELASVIEQYLQATGPRRRVPVFEGYMTEREREFKTSALSQLIGQYKNGVELEADEAARALSLAAALGQHAQPHKDTLLELVTTVLGLPLTSDKPEKVSIAKGKPEHHTFELVRGVTLSLAWDGALVALRFDPIEYRRRQKALSFVGIAADSNTDVARNHDAYIWTAPDER